MKRIYKIQDYSMNWNPDGTLNGKVRVKVVVDLAGDAPDADVVEAMDGTQETVTGTLAAHLASQAARETGETLTATDLDVN